MKRLGPEAPEKSGDFQESVDDPQQRLVCPGTEPALPMGASEGASGAAVSSLSIRTWILSGHHEQPTESGSLGASQTHASMSVSDGQTAASLLGCISTQQWRADGRRQKAALFIPAVAEKSEARSRDPAVKRIGRTTWKLCSVYLEQSICQHDLRIFTSIIERTSTQSHPLSPMRVCRYPGTFKVSRNFPMHRFGSHAPRTPQRIELALINPLGPITRPHGKHPTTFTRPQIRTNTTEKLLRVTRKIPLCENTACNGLKDSCTPACCYLEIQNKYTSHVIRKHLVSKVAQPCGH
jgi:hypothetical protein